MKHFYSISFQWLSNQIFKQLKAEKSNYFHLSNFNFTIIIVTLKFIVYKNLPFLAIYLIVLLLLFINEMT